MSTVNPNPLYWAAFKARDDLNEFGVDALLLFALQMKFGIEDIKLVASTSLTEGSDDKKADLVHIDSEMRYAIVAQTYLAQDIAKKEAPANKASDLNTAISWLLSRPLDDLPETIKSHAQELRQAIEDDTVESIHIWYVHNLPESENVRSELTTVGHTANAALRTNFPAHSGIEVLTLEVGSSTLEEWYKSISTPILVTDEFCVPVSGGFEIGEANWKAYSTSVPAKWLYEQFQKHKTRLFSANVREYLGSRNIDNNINNGIKETAGTDPEHFWVYNNGITALVHSFHEEEEGGKKEIHFQGISIVNGAQTVGAIASLDAPPVDKARVQVRFITCTDVNTVYDIVRYNNSQNKITAPDFRSNDTVQRRLVREFEGIPRIRYFPRRGGHEDIIRRRPDALPSVTAGQVLAAFHGDPGIAYHQKTHMWEDNTLYSKYFNEQTTASHILFAYSLLRAIENKKLDLWSKSRENSLKETEKTQLDFFRKRGAAFLLVAATARCLETILNKQVPNKFGLAFKGNLSPQEAVSKWSAIVETSSALAPYLIDGLADGFKTRERVDNAIQKFRSLIDATRQTNAPIYASFAEQVK